jgi:hypothetical protein
MITVSVGVWFKQNSWDSTAVHPTIDAGGAQTNGTIMRTLHLSPDTDSVRARIM